MALEDKVLKILGRGAATWDGLRGEVGVSPGELDAAIRNLEGAHEITRDRGRFHLNGAEPTPNSVAAQASAEEAIVATKKKVCSNCTDEKPLDDFPVNKECTDGHSNQCKQCIGDKAKARRLAKLGRPAAAAKAPVASQTGKVVVAVSFPKVSAVPPVMILHFQDGVRIGPVHTSDAGVAQMPYHVDISAEQLDELVTWWTASRKSA